MTRMNKKDCQHFPSKRLTRERMDDWMKKKKKKVFGLAGPDLA